MKGLNLLPLPYQKAIRRNRYQKVILVGIGGLYLVSGYLMWRPSEHLAQKQGRLRALTYQLQDTRFEEVKALSGKRDQLASTVAQGEAQIRQLSARTFPIEVLLYNLLYGMPEGMRCTRLIVEGKTQSVVIEGESKHHSDTMNRLRRIRSIYPQDEVDFVVEKNSEGTYTFQLVLTLKGAANAQS
ncbi:MAG: hypothetical protein ACRCYD_11200 [Plesiomonas sp.]